ncbi:transcriptional regulator GcvA [Propionivibrio dicarboxylicus]|uniref:LysR family transcriptional regulator, glycine cleavage system transcriptional activator n=1 Tax=Propionivibrio dicarboxylicus TaxID=83767 RepID=A0A1G8H842_9RHOO|nr:transcriptional regulator GcvA [Propionivibrio dicarboxylicus]SDI02670.1 LysR family transcriptional regulator, glycine cleavage system transcriptional activator [Propionivibrio dicarboxylicus]
MSNRVSFKAVQAFEAAARLSSFGLAAEELYVTPSAISHQIKSLESQYDVQLFHRVHRGVVLTDAGRRYAEEISAAFSRIEAATKDLGRTTKSDILTIHSTPSFATQWLMPRLARFSAKYPDIDVRLNASKDPVDLITQNVDVDIRYEHKNIQPAGVKTVDFPPETIVPLCSPSLVSGANPIRCPKDLERHTLIHSEVCLVNWRDWQRRHPDVKLDLKRGPRFDRSFMSISAAIDGLGVCLESLLIVQRELETGRLVAPLGVDGLKVKGYTFNVLKSSAELPKVHAFQEWLFSEIPEISDPGQPQAAPVPVKRQRKTVSIEEAWQGNFLIE